MRVIPVILLTFGALFFLVGKKAADCTDARVFSFVTPCLTCSYRTETGVYTAKHMMLENRVVWQGGTLKKGQQQQQQGQKRRRTGGFTTRTRLGCLNMLLVSIILLLASPVAVTATTTRRLKGKRHHHDNFTASNNCIPLGKLIQCL